MDYSTEAPLWKVATQAHLESALSSKHYKDTYLAIKETIKRAGNAVASREFPLNSSDVVIDRVGTTENKIRYNIEISRVSQWYGTVYLLNNKDHLRVSLKIIFKQEDVVRGRSLSIGSGYYEGSLIASLVYHQVPHLEQLVADKKAIIMLVVEIPDSSPKYFGTTAAMQLGVINPGDISARTISVTAILKNNNPYAPDISEK